MNRVNEQIVRMGDSPCTDLMQKSEADARMNDPCSFKAPTQTGRSMVEMLFSMDRYLYRARTLF